MLRSLTPSFRWYGPGDPVSLNEIVQTGAKGVFTALHDIPYGEAWSRAAIRQRLGELASAGLSWEAVESVPVSEAIRTRTGDFEQHLENYRQTLTNLGAEGVSVVIYNFMPVLDWVRTDLAWRLSDGTECLRFDPVRFAAFELFLLKRPGADSDYTPDQLNQAEEFFKSLSVEEIRVFERGLIDVFPGVKMGLSLDELRAMLARYDGIDADGLREHYRRFLEAVVPAAEEAGVRLAVHPDDPPFPILGLRRIVSTQADLEKIVTMVDSPSNGICYCTGSLSARLDNDLVEIAETLGDRIHATHLRSVAHEADGSFYEANHLEGAVNMPAVVQALQKVNARRADGASLSYRPDHGHRMLDDLEKPQNPNPGYDLIGRMKGMAEIEGIQQALQYISK